MTSNYPKAILSNFDGDYRQAYEHLSKVYLVLAEFAERCAEALEQIRRVFNGAGDTEASETMPDKMYVIANRALGLEKE